MGGVRTRLAGCEGRRRTVSPLRRVVYPVNYFVVDPVNRISIMAPSPGGHDQRSRKDNA